VRLSLCCILILFACSVWVAPCSAKPNIVAPTGTTLTTGQVRAEAALDPTGDGSDYYRLSAGFAQLELDVMRVETPRGRKQNLFGVQMCYLPETFYTPAVGFGISDIASQGDGVGFYGAITKSLPEKLLPPIVTDLKATVGVGLFGIRGPFAGFEVVFPKGFFAQGEWDSRNLSGAIGWQPAPLVRIKAYSIRGDFKAGIEIPPLAF